MKKGIIFDMDGTLWDSAAGVAESWNEAILAYGYERKPLTAGDIQSVMGKTMEDIADILFPELNVMQRKELLDLCCRLENDYLRRHGGVLYPDIRKTMEKLKVNYHLYIVSNCQSGYIEAFLKYYKFEKYFDDFDESILSCIRNTIKDQYELEKAQEFILQHPLYFKQNYQFIDDDKKICSSCKNKVNEIPNNNVCMHCGAEISRCRCHPYRHLFCFERNIAVYPYQPPMSYAVHRLKFKKLPQQAYRLAIKMVDKINFHYKDISFDYILFEIN